MNCLLGCEDSIFNPTHNLIGHSIADNTITDKKLSILACCGLVILTLTYTLHHSTAALTQCMIRISRQHDFGRYSPGAIPF